MLKLCARTPTRSCPRCQHSYYGSTSGTKSPKRRDNAWNMQDETVINAGISSYSGLERWDSSPGPSIFRGIFRNTKLSNTSYIPKDIPEYLAKAKMPPISGVVACTLCKDLRNRAKALDASPRLRPVGPASDIANAASLACCRSGIRPGGWGGSPISTVSSSGGRAGTQASAEGQPPPRRSRSTRQLRGGWTRGGVRGALRSASGGE